MVAMVTVAMVRFAMYIFNMVAVVMVMIATITFDIDAVTSVTVAIVIVAMVMQFLLELHNKRMFNLQNEGPSDGAQYPQW